MMERTTDPGDAAGKPGDGRTERCEACGRVTRHDVRIEILTESREGENAAFSREPYRIATCSECGATTRQRMNDV